jgi:hypothetical protein
MPARRRRLALRNPHGARRKLTRRIASQAKSNEANELASAWGMRMSWLQKQLPPKIKSTSEKKGVPEGLWLCDQRNNRSYLVDFDGQVRTSFPSPCSMPALKRVVCGARNAFPNR